MKKQAKTELIKMRVTPEFKAMAIRKANKYGYTNLSGWLDKIIRAARG